MAEGGLRLDKWLWFARLAKSRSVAQSLCESRHIRVDGRVVERAAQTVRIGQVLTLPVPAGGARTIRILALPARRGPFAEASHAYAALDSGATALTGVRPGD